jgi:hypothetical protein
MRIVCLLCLIFPLTACEPAPATEAVPSATQPTPNTFDLDTYCNAMCKRTATCSLEAAEEAASLGGDKTEEALRTTKSELAALRERCVAGCRAEPVDPLDASLAERANRCLQQVDCAGVERCLAAL